MFSKETAEKAEKQPAGEGALSVVAHGMNVVGDIDSNGVLKIEGRVEGSIRTARQVLVGRQGEVKGDIHTREAIIGGTVTGTITATERVELKEGAVVNGDVTTKSIVVLEGAKINGTVRMTDAPIAFRPGEQRPRDHRTPAVAVLG